MADKNTSCCGKTVTETNTTVTKYGMEACPSDLPAGLTYVGMRYIINFADPIQWSSEAPYEHLTAVQNEGFTYISKKAVPVGVPVNNDEFWLLWADPNSQMEELRRLVEQYAETVESFDGRITENAEAIQDEATAREEADNGLSQAIQDEATAREAADTALRNEILSMKKHAVIIGDSYSATGYGDVTSGKHWWNIVCKQLNVTPHSYARGGTGFISQYTPLFNTQIDSAAADTSFNNADVSHVFIFGGRNDMKAGIWNQSNFTNAITTALTNAKASFPNAQIILIGINTFINFTTVDNNYNYTDFIATRFMHDYAMANGVAFINMLGALVGMPNYFANDGHPNNAGQAVIAGYVLSGLNGNVSAPPYRTFNITETNGDNPQGLAVTMCGGKFKLSGLVTMPSDGVLTMTAPYGIGAFNYATQFAGISNDSAHELYYFMRNSDTGKIQVNGTASKRITLMGELQLPFAW